MKKLIFIIFMLFLTISCFSQLEQLYWQKYGLDQSHYYYISDIQFYNGDLGIASAPGPALFKTTDKGNNWPNTPPLHYEWDGNYYNKPSFTFLNNSTGFIEYENVIKAVNISDGTFMQTVANLPLDANNTFDNPNKIRMINNTLGYAIFSGKINNILKCGLMYL